MPRFMYIAKNLQGQKKTDIAEALDEQVLLERLQADGLFVLEMTEVLSTGDKKMSDGRRLAKKGMHQNIKLEDYLNLAHQLATLLEAGVNLLQALTMLIPQVQSQRLAAVITKVRDDVEQGKAFSQALSAHPKVFNQFWVSLAQVGEASGTMPTILTKLAAHLEQQDATRNAIISAMIYPLILLAASFGAVVFFALVVSPQFEAVFKSMDAQMPMLTQLLLSSFQFIRSNIIFIILAIASVVFSFRLWLKTASGQDVFERVISKVPVLGETVTMALTERFAAQMTILVDSGVPILAALEIIEPMMEHRHASAVIERARDDVRNGKSLAESIGNGGFFPDMAIQMIHVGEQTGDLGQIFGHVAHFYNNKVQTVVKRLSIIIEPVMLFFMAGTIGTIAIAIFLPLFKLGQGRGGP